jgi:hypothetical protein
MEGPLNPTVSLLCKLGSIAIHAEEIREESGHYFDSIALQQLFRDAEVRKWLDEMDAMSLIPKKRTDRREP